MVKKKRQSNPSENGDDSTESCEENVKSTCCHITKAVDLNTLRKSLKVNGGLSTECSECKKEGKIEAVDPDFVEDASLWMCLRCGSQLCGRARNQHAFNHFKTPHSDCHDISACTESWSIYCYKCNDEIHATSSKKLSECIDYLKKQTNTNLKPSPPIQLYLNPAEEDNEVGKDIISKGKNKAMGLSLPRVRGLSNLGNTCFFNSVMQCLVQTPYLLNVLQEMSMPGEKFTLPGGKLKLKANNEDEAKELDLKPIAGELAEWGILTKTLAETLADLKTGEGSVYTPSRLLGALINKLPQFAGGNQHDSHELLRHLLEAVRSEDLRRYQSVILTSLGMKKADPSRVDGELKQIVKFYGQQASDTMLRPEQVFRGFLVSTLECQECHHQSDRQEYFLDLSLPVAASRPQPPALQRRKTNEEPVYNTQDENKPSKHQLKKERKRVMKSRKNKSGTTSTKSDENTATDGNDATKTDGKSSSEQSDADIEDNLEDAPRPETHSVGVQAVAHTAANFAANHLESGYNSDKVISSDSIRTSPVDLDKEKTDNTPEVPDKDKLVDIATSTIAIPLEYKPLVTLENLSNPDSGVASPEATKHNSTETVDNVESPLNGRKELGSHSSLSSEINLDLPSPQQKNSPTKSEYERPVSRISFVPEYSNEIISRGISVEGCRNLLEQDFITDNDKNKDSNTITNHQEVIEKLDKLELNDKPSKPMYPSPITVENSSEPPPTAPKPKLNNIEMDKSRDYLSYNRPSPLSPRYISDEDECSIQSCLSQFTALELLTGNNKVGCETCTEKINGKDGKTVYTNATKRFLVSSPPAILILHLKRFQLGPRCIFRKMSKHVDFPIVLDLAPFCAMDKVRKLPNVSKTQNELLYSLYGIVEHSGSMHGGHYVAYVKVRQQIKTDDPKWWFLPKSANIPPGVPVGNGDVEPDVESDLSGYESGESQGPIAEPPPGKWYYVSDSMVSEISEEKVLRAQAYLLFYERIV